MGRTIDTTWRNSAKATIVLIFTCAPTNDQQLPKKKNGWITFNVCVSYITSALFWNILQLGQKHVRVYTWTQHIERFLCTTCFNNIWPFCLNLLNGATGLGQTLTSNNYSSKLLPTKYWGRVIDIIAENLAIPTVHQHILASV